MFGNTYPIAGIDRMNDRQRNVDLEEYVRLEFRPADRSTVIFALRRASHDRGPRGPKPRLAWRIRSWWAAPKPDGKPTQP
jgi:hypothetical protein